MMENKTGVGTGRGLGMPAPAAQPYQHLRARQNKTHSLDDLSVNAMRMKIELESMLYPEMLRQPLKDRPDYEAQERKLEQLRQVVDQMERLIPTERQAQQRDMYKRKVDSYRENCAAFAKKLEQQKARSEQHFYEAQQREMLFRSKTEDRNLNIQDYEAENASLRRSNQVMSNLIALGNASLENLRNQGTILARARTTLLDISTRLGMSNSLLRVIERKEWGNAMLVFGGMLFTSIFLFLVYYYTRK